MLHLSEFYHHGLGPSQQSVVLITDAISQDLDRPPVARGPSFVPIKNFIVAGHWLSAEEASGEERYDIRPHEFQVVIPTEGESKNGDKNGDSCNSKDKSDTEGGVPLPSSQGPHGCNLKDKDTNIVNKNLEHSVCDCLGEKCTNLVRRKSQGELLEEARTVQHIVKALKLMPDLEMFKWTSDLPITGEVLSIVLTQRTLGELWLDLLRPGIRCHTLDGDELPRIWLAPAYQIGCLRKITLTGMLDSYQFEIWKIAFLSPALKELILEMIPEPNIRSDHANDWPFIQGDHWLKSEEEVSMSYHGDNGSGRIHYRLGYGEYLDEKAMHDARESAKQTRRVGKVLSIEVLRLKGFVVDARPFFKYFDPTQLHVLELEHCIDAGLALPRDMWERITIICPEDGRSGYEAVVAMGKSTKEEVARAAGFWRKQGVHDRIESGEMSQLVERRDGEVIATSPTFDHRNILNNEAAPHDEGSVDATNEEAMEFSKTREELRSMKWCTILWLAWSYSKTFIS
ncbi:MAG: hypothetical protein M1819_004715 [Sarea resinae]|nr:MAG: hypothetical protein M1819_004715 [Sarea resinae]